jgi:uncharacterized RDD family membrane protein YckC
MSWYYAESGQQRGPVTDAELNDLAQAGSIRDDTLVWREGMADWQPYGKVRGEGRSAAPPLMGAIVCSQCGKSFSADEVVRMAEGWVCAACKPVYVQRLREGASVSLALDYAGFWIRFAAKFIDGLILGAVLVIPIFIFFFVVARAGSGNFAADPFDVLLGQSRLRTEGLVANVIGLFAQMIFMVINVAYSTFFLGKYGATPGKMACRLKVVDAEGGAISYGRAFGRSCAEILSRLICLIGYIIAAFDGQKRALHDHICSTRVVHNR